MRGPFFPPRGIVMPYQHNESRRHKFPKAMYRITNWPEYDAALLRRGSLTVWFTEDAVASWRAEGTGKRGGQPVYCDIAIATGVAVRLVFHQPLRQTEGLLRSIAELLGLAIPIPDHPTLSRRGGGLTVLPERIKRDEPLHLLVDSTGLKRSGEGEWLNQKHGIRTRRHWRKLHLAIDADTQEIVACNLTEEDVGDVSAVPHLLDQIEGALDAITADGAYDGEPTDQVVAERHPEAAVIIPPRSTAVLSTTAVTQRDRHIEAIATDGRMSWQRASRYHRRSLVETGMFRYKTIIGRRLYAKSLPNQRAEAKVACNVLNRMTHWGMPVSRRVR